MDEYEFIDSLAQSHLTCKYPGLATKVDDPGNVGPCESLFFPGCSLLNYAMPLVQALYDLLKNAGRVQGISLLCCGKILEYDVSARESCLNYKEKLAARFAATGVKRVVAICPNCVQTLRRVLALREDTKDIEVVPASAELVALGHRVDPDTVRSMVSADWLYQQKFADNDRPLKLSIHDSCPDRATGEFADAVRTIMPAELIVEPKHVRKQSFCCGSRVRAIGKLDLAKKMVGQNSAEAADAQAQGIVTSCMSCAFLLSRMQQDMPVFHYLEFLFSWRIDWYHADEYMKLRFLLDDEVSKRKFMNIDRAE